MKHFKSDILRRSVEARKQLIVSAKLRRGPTNDLPDFPRVFNRALTAGLPVKLVVIDKDRDAESNHEYAQVVLWTRTAIPVRAANRQKRVFDDTTDRMFE